MIDRLIRRNATVQRYFAASPAGSRLRHFFHRADLEARRPSVPHWSRLDRALAGVTIGVVDQSLCAKGAVGECSHATIPAVTSDMRPFIHYDGSRS